MGPRALGGLLVECLLNFTAASNHSPAPPVQSQVSVRNQQVTEHLLNLCNSFTSFTHTMGSVFWQDMLNQIGDNLDHQTMNGWLRGFSCGVAASRLSPGWSKNALFADEEIEMVVLSKVPDALESKGVVAVSTRVEISCLPDEDTEVGATHGHADSLLGYFHAFLTAAVWNSSGAAAISPDAFLSSSGWHLGMGFDSRIAADHYLDMEQQRQRQDEQERIWRMNMENNHTKVQLWLHGARVGTCRMRAGDTPRAAAARFIFKHSLDASFRAPLRLLLKRMAQDGEHSCVQLKADLVDLRSDYIRLKSELS